MFSRSGTLSLPSKSYREINDKWLCFRNLEIGSGSFGAVFYGMDFATKNEYAIKFEEKNKQKTSAVKEEVEIYKSLQGVLGVPKVYDLTDYKKYNVIVLDLLGPSLEKFIKVLKPTFSLSTVVFFGSQMVERVRDVHKRGYIHRDIKPNNFSLGKFSRRLPYYGLTEPLVYIFDFGLSCRYLDADLNHYELKDDKFIGTPRYASINTHKGCRQSRRDDLESVFYVLAYFLNGDLPWQAVKAKSKGEKKKKIQKVKEDTAAADLFKSPTLAQALDEIKQLKFEQTPDYDRIIKQLQLSLNKSDIDAEKFEMSFYEALDKVDEREGKRLLSELFVGYPELDLDDLVTNLDTVRFINAKKYLKFIN